MKALLVTLSVLICLAISSRGQGTIAFGNTALTRAQVINVPGGGEITPVTFSFNVAVYFAPTPGAWQGPVLPLGRSVSGSPGLFTAPTVYQIPGTQPSQTVYMQIYAWQAQYGDDPYQAWREFALTAITDVREVTLGATFGPGTVVWQSASGVDPNRFTPLTFYLGASAPPPVVPEPSSLVLLAAPGAVAFFFRRRRA
jgi:hypothetical protein